MNNRLISSIIASNIALALSPNFVLADDNPVAIDKIVVTATRTPQALDDTIAPTIVIDREEIERSQALDTADLLRFHAGIDIGRNGGPGQVTSAFIRGADSNQTLVLIDGVRINPGTIGGAAIQNIHPDLIERIEVVKGPRSVLFGSNAIGGVINIITRRAEQDSSRASARVSYGRFNTRQHSAGFHHSKNDLRLGIDFNALDSNGFPTRQESNIDAAHDNRSFNAYFGATVNNVDIELSHWAADGSTEFLDFLLAPQEQDQRNRATTLKIENAFNDYFSSIVKFSQVRDDIEQVDSNDFVETDNFIFDWQNDISISDSHLLTAGLVLSRENNDSLSFGTAFDEDTDTDDIYLQSQIDLGKQQLILGAHHTDHSDFGGEFVWSVEYGINITSRTKINASAGKAFRAPDATDRFGFGGNADLDPERSRNIEIGVQHQINEKHSVYATVFRNKIDDLINFFDSDGFLGPIPGINVNVDNATIEGLELGYQGTNGQWDYSIEGIIQNPVNNDTGSVLARRAKRSLTTQINYNIGKLRLGGDLLLTSRRNDSDFSTVENAGYLLVNLGSSYQLTPSLAVSAKIENVLDTDYELANNFNTPGRGLFVEFRYAPKI